VSTHPHVPHPRDLLAEVTRGRTAFDRGHDAVLAWLASHVLASKLMFDVALIAPLLVLPGPDSLKITLGVISGSWIQWWGLPAIQRSQVAADAQRDAKANADHQALSHVAATGDSLMEGQARIEALLTRALDQWARRAGRGPT